MKNKINPYLLNIGIITFVFITLSIVMEFTPFGPSTMLTVDLGQQYIDFFNLFKETITKDPTLFFYSFEKALGGEMAGLWGYYLYSPYNFILLLFSDKYMPLGVTVLSYLKIASTSLSMLYFIRQKYQIKTLMSQVFSLCYALMSYMIVFLLNIMWIDGLILLPLIALGLDRIIKKEKPWLYVGSLAIALIANYYIGYMICLFLSFYALFVIIENCSEEGWKQWGINYLTFIKYSIIGVLISGITLVPTALSLMSSKGSYTKFDLSLDTSYSLGDMLSKLFIASYNNDELSSGSPNLYVGLFVFIFVLVFFLEKRIHFKEKIMAMITFIIFFCSFHFDSLNKLWHGGQFPIWYEYRFSFTASFFLVVLAIKAFKANRGHLNNKQIVSILTIGGLSSLYYLYDHTYEYLDGYKIIVSLVFLTAYLVILQIKHHSLTSFLRQVIILMVVTSELMLNAGFIFNEFNYVQNSKFNDYISILNASLEGLRNGQNDFYRIHKTFMRTKNEAMFTHYNGLDHFGSTLEARVPELYGYLGLPDGNGFVTYTNGTLFTDDFFNVRYLIDVTNDTDLYTSPLGYKLYPQATDFDIEAHPIIDTQNRYVIHENQERLGLGMEVSSNVVNSKFKKHQPIENQELLLKLIDFNGTKHAYFKKHPVSEPIMHNVILTDTGDGDYYTYKRTQDKYAYVEFKFNTSSNNPFYFTLPSQFTSKNVKLSLNGERYRFYTPYRHRQITNASYKHVENNQTFRFFLEKNEIQVNQIYLYEFDEKRYNEMIHEKQNYLFKIDSFKNNQIEGHIETQLDQSYLLFTIPYDANWKVRVDGEKVETYSVLSDTLLAIPVSKGNHQVILTYSKKPQYLGGISTVIGILLLFLDYYWYKKRKSKSIEI